MNSMHGTTILAVRRFDQVAMAGDGQVTLGETVLKQKAKKLRQLYDDQILAGFAGSAADALTLLEKFEGFLATFKGNLTRASVELVKEWRTDRVLRRLEALLVVADRENLLVLSGSGELLAPDDPVAAIGSGGPYALAAARALLRHTQLSAEEIVRASLGITSEICLYTNSEIQVLVL